jgi:hypothetical protein
MLDNISDGGTYVWTAAELRRQANRLRVIAEQFGDRKPRMAALYLAEAVELDARLATMEGTS